MRGKGTHTHAIRVPDEDREGGYVSSYLHGLAFCGERQLAAFGTAEGPDARKAETMRNATCPDCSKAIGKARLAQLGGRVALSPAPDKVAKRFRSAWSIAIDGVPLGYVVSEAGFGKGWELHQLPKDDHESDWRTTGGKISPDMPKGYRNSRPNADATYQDVHLASRDAMACAAVRARDRRELLTPAERQVIADEHKARRKAEEAEREAASAARAVQREAEAIALAERRDLALAGLKTALERSDLSNMERAGLSEALNLLVTHRP